MKSFNISINDIANIDNIKKAIRAAAKRKRKRKNVLYVLENIDSEAEVVSNLLLRGELGLKQHKEITIWDGTNKKERTIICPTFRYEQIIHHAVIQAIEPVLTHGMYEHSLAAIPGRGAHSGAKKIKHWIRTSNKIKYVFKMDIRHFFQSVNQDILKKMLTKKIRNKQVLNILFQIIESYPKGLPLGFYTSHWFANFYLQGLDHYIKEELRIPHMMRYMDDIVMFSSNKGQLHKAHFAIEKYLKEELDLTIKDNWQVFRFDYVSKNYVIDGDASSQFKKCKVRNNKTYVNAKGKKLPYPIEYIRKGRPLDFMGFVFFRDKTILRKHIMISISRRCRRFKLNRKTASGLISYMGYMKYTDTYNMYQKHVKPNVNIRKLKRYVKRCTK